MFIGAFGQFWSRDLVDWEARKWSLLGRRGINTGSISVVDFRRARGVYVLYDDVGVYYVGLAASSGGIGRRLRDHTKDEMGYGWTRFSWFSFDGPSDSDQDSRGVFGVEKYDSIELTSGELIREVEALLQTVTQPYANGNRTSFVEAHEWTQVATAQPEVVTFDHLAPRITPTA